MSADADGAAVHRLAGEQALARGHRLLDADTLEAACAAAGIDRDRLAGAARRLAARQVLDVHFFGPSRITLVRLTTPGLAAHLEATRRDLDDLRRQVRAAVARAAAGGHLGTPLDLAAALGQPSLLVEVLLDELRDGGDLVFTPTTGGRVLLHRVGRPPAEDALRED